MEQHDRKRFGRLFGGERQAVAGIGIAAHLDDAPGFAWWWCIGNDRWPLVCPPIGFRRCADAG
ncbi:MAG: hypothetical protein IPJ12_13380 [Betaproteobacteria bacterium]|nr:hypothetical protein [Betaproteobacteria bacterium]